MSYLNFARKFTSFSIILSLLVLQNCASIFNGGSQSIVATASGDVDNIPVEITTSDGSYRSKLPTTIVTSPSSFNDTTIVVKDKCYEETQMKVNKSITPSFWSNILFGGLIGMSIDYFSGHMWKMDRHAVVPLNENGECKKK
jgi:hypothetical protein